MDGLDQCFTIFPEALLQMICISLYFLSPTTYMPALVFLLSLLLHNINRQRSKPGVPSLLISKKSGCECRKTLEKMPENSTEIGEYSRPAANMGSVNEIEEEISSEVFDLPVRIPETFVQNRDEEDVYVAVGKSDSSVDALAWTLKHAVNQLGFVYLVHVFPEVRNIPTPWKLPKSQVSPEQVESYMNQERSKRKQILEKLLDLCHASKVKVDTLLIESDFIATAVLDLIPILNIKKLVVGTSKSSLRNRKSSRRGSGVAYQIIKSAPNSCEVKIICEGKQVSDQMIVLSSPRRGDVIPNNTQIDQKDDSFSCTCFTRKFI